MNTKLMEAKYAKPRIPCLALRAGDAAAALGISRRKFQELVAGKLIPHKKIHGMVLFPVDALREWLLRDVTDGKDQTLRASDGQYHQ